ncbi:tRNA lysidine(34) synthetase TilS [Candidatus Epulonipiscium fishelsonii]|uniref:tRNA lysidine(34) synthetase TilS n=1 Tax=Candidatus Epulonipiscium fishelsonii TaxID=77094 RepID=A0ACC8XG64_9FIRM|nr:tRNA lysidine(34) synthetase TilS [Epulopiscium sp. SCG-B11WGA-EpuloA1]ONI42958.1 tRNA lysidine(34) synthetase TilS [Epulopiscium sp. SCG-B05WGA-EpuloA1]
MDIQKIENIVRCFIEENKLIDQKDNLVIGVSGGADSMMILHFLVNNYDLKMVVAHVNHGVRWEAILDMNYVLDISRQWKIECKVYNCNINEISKKKKISVEEAGRQERYKFFNSLSDENTKIVTAHNKNDQVETMIMRFFRGTDTKGLGGILVKRNNIIRPILCLSREQIEFYCNFYNINFQIDHTNLMAIYTRNRIRLEFLPYIIEHINPNILNTLYSQGELYKEQEQFLSYYVQNFINQYVIVKEKSYAVYIKDLKNEFVYMQKKILLEIINLLINNLQNITSKHLEQAINLLNKSSGKQINLPNSIVVRRSYDFLEIGLFSYEDVNYEVKDLHIGENYFMNFQIKLKEIKFNSKTFKETTQNMYTKYIDYDKIKIGLQIRCRKAGDKIMLSSGTKKLKKYFIDEKVPLHMRSEVPLIVNDMEIVWIIGGPLNVDYYIHEDTKNILEISIEKMEVIC